MMKSVENPSRQALSYALTAKPQWFGPVSIVPGAAGSFGQMWFCFVFCLFFSVKTAGLVI